MAIDPEIISSVKKTLEESQPLLVIERMKEELLKWLEQVKLPSKCGQSSWEGLIKTYPAQPHEVGEVSGTRMRIALDLFTAQNRYLFAILENLKPSSRSVYTAALFVNGKKEQRQLQKMVEEAYFGDFDDLPRASSILSAQTVRYGGLAEAMKDITVALIGHEFVGESPVELSGTPLKMPTSIDPDFPLPRKKVEPSETPPS